MYALMSSSFLPNVDTKYPLAQKFSPVKFLLRFPKFLAIHIALLPLTYPTTCATAYLGGIDISICTWSDIRCPSHTLLYFCWAKSLIISPKYFLSCPYRIFLRFFGIQTIWYLQSQTVWFKLCLLSIGSLLSVNFERFTAWRLSYIPANVKLWESPGKAGGLPMIISA